MGKFFRNMFFIMMAFAMMLSFFPMATVQAAALPDHPDGSDHTLVPGTATGKEQVIHDQVNTSTAEQKRAFGGEQYSVGRFERPFDQDMKYLPYLDIVKSTMQRDDPNFVYVTIQVTEPLDKSLDKPASYGLELDPNLDGRSEFLLLAARPKSTEWSVVGVNVWKSSSAEKLLAADGPSIPVTGSAGFDMNLFEAGKGDDLDLAWARLSPDKPDTVEIAFKNSLIGGEKGKFVWRPVTDGAAYPTTVYDLNVSYTLEQAGSPIGDSMFYPLKDVYAVDSTCRVASGYEATGKEAGLCPLPPPPARSDPKSTRSE